MVDGGLFGLGPNSVGGPSPELKGLLVRRSLGCGGRGFCRRSRLTMLAPCRSVLRRLLILRIEVVVELPHGLLTRELVLFAKQLHGIYEVELSQDIKRSIDSGHSRLVETRDVSRRLGFGVA